jgi:quinol monooxygenase YgiN
MMAVGVATDARAQTAPPPAPTPFYVVTYIEVVPALRGEAATLLRQLAGPSRKDAGNLRFEVLQRTTPASHFAILEAWQDQKAFEAHVAAAHTKEFREKLKPILSSAYDERPHGGLAVGEMNTPAGKRSLYVVTHVDFIPPRKDDGIAAIKVLADATRKSDGPQRYEVLQQSSRPNHLTLVETWKNQRAIDAHWIAAHTRKFRDELLPMSGSLFDERIYKALN